MRTSDRIARTIPPLALTLALATGCTSTVGEGDDGRGPGGKADYGTTAADYKVFRDGLHCEEDTGACIVEGDIAIHGEEALQKYFKQSVEFANTQLTVMTVDDEDATWNRLDRFDLSYCVSDEFGDDKDEIVEALQGAMEEWREIANLEFTYHSDQDKDCDLQNPRVLFTVTTSPGFSFYYARAFFPSSEPDQRQIRVNLPSIRSADEANLSLQGILRHELGHVLGFRHEHVRPEANSPQCWEDPSWRPVMHYPHCNGKGDWTLKLTRTDRNGAKLFYPVLDERLSTRCWNRELDASGNVRRDCDYVAQRILELVDNAPEEVLHDHAKLDA
ncbi:MAG: matrixin family metalloprotease, partial [Myxococcales bacterium]|nr:matrixin family metalloprotease [Myxococcales bacterium]